MVAEEETGPDGFGRAVRSLVELFYAVGSLLASMRSERLQWVFDSIMDLFDRVGMSDRNQEGFTISSFTLPILYIIGLG